jgi:hypothetical protein
MISSISKSLGQTKRPGRPGSPARDPAKLAPSQGLVYSVAEEPNRSNSRKKQRWIKNPGSSPFGMTGKLSPFFFLVNFLLDNRNHALQDNNTLLQGHVASHTFMIEVYTF